MADIEKVIYDIERCICHVPDACRDCSHDWHDATNDCMEKLLSDALKLLKEKEEKPLRCDKCCYHREDGWCAMYERWVRETDYCSFGAWKSW